MIKINEASANSAIIKMYDHLQTYIKDGFAGGNAFALVDGYKNVFNLHRAEESLVIEFDLSETLQRMPINSSDLFDSGRLTLSTIGISIATKNADDIINELKEQERTLNPTSKDLIINTVSTIGGSVIGIMVGMGGLYLIYRLMFLLIK
jgi:hypothetical protein